MPRLISRRWLALMVAGAALSMGLEAQAFDPRYQPRPKDISSTAQMWPAAPLPPADSNVRPDCRETKVSLEQLLTLARTPEVKNQTDFLAALPNGSFQSFTLLAESDSPEKPCISKKFPGIIRMTTTANIVMRYTGDQDCALYDRMQMLVFDDTSRKWSALEIDFNLPPKTRVNLHPESCQNCHSPSSTKIDLRPNWQPYNQWKGFFSGNDDESDIEDLAYEKRFLSARSDLKDRIKSGDLQGNANYRDLPWYTGNAKEYGEYPYSIYPYGRSDHYDVRTNLRFTEVLSHRMGQRVARMTEALPSYPQRKYQILAAHMLCGGVARDKLEKDLQFRSAAYYDTGSDVLADILPRLGLKKSDLTMHFNQIDRTDFAAGIAPHFIGESRDVGILDVAAGELLKGLAKKQKEFEKFLNFSRGESGHFGERFACIDDLGGKIMLNGLGRSDLCDLLQQKDEKLQNDLRMEPAKAPELFSTSGPAKPVAHKSSGTTPLLPADQSWDPTKVVEGQRVLKSVCASCHGANDSKVRADLHFFKDPQVTKEALCSTRLLEKVKSRVANPAEPMPPYGSFDSVPDSQIQTVVDYLTSIQSQCDGK